MDKTGEVSKESNMLEILFSNSNEGEFPVYRWRYDLSKINAFFGDGKLGPQDFKYHVKQHASDDEKDRLTFGLEPRAEGGWTTDEFLAPNSPFETLCKIPAAAAEISSITMLPLTALTPTSRHALNQRPFESLRDGQSGRKIF